MKLAENKWFMKSYVKKKAINIQVDVQNRFPYLPNFPFWWGEISL